MLTPLKSGAFSLKKTHQCGTFKLSLKLKLAKGAKVYDAAKRGREEESNPFHKLSSIHSDDIFACNAAQRPR